MVYTVKSVYVCAVTSCNPRHNIGRFNYFPFFVVNLGINTIFVSRTTKRPKVMKESQNKFTCVICDDQFSGYGNNAEPVKDGKCCDKCNFAVVVKARIEELIKNQPKD